MNIFKVSEKEREEIVNKILNDLTPEQLLEELIECGLDIDPILDDEISNYNTKYQEEEYYSIKSQYTWLDYIKNRTRSNKEMVA